LILGWLVFEEVGVGGSCARSSGLPQQWKESSESESSFVRKCLILRMVGYKENEAHRKKWGGFGEYVFNCRGFE
jgi:hypothetical protein